MRDPIRCCLLAALLVFTSATSACGARDSGDEIDVGEDYGTTSSQDVGATFTDGVSVVEIKKGPIRLISARPILSAGDVVQYLGARVRLLGRPEWISATSADGYPPISPEMAGSVPVENFEMAGPTPGEAKTYFEVMFGFKIKNAGRATRRGAELVYEYDGTERKAFIPSYMAVCAPKVPAGKCAGEDSNGSVPPNQ